MNILLSKKHIIINNKNKNKNECQKVHWSKYKSDTRIGWRRPIMLWNDVKNGKDVYYNNDESESDNK